MKRWLRARLFSICWDIGDTFMGWAFRLDDSPKTLHEVPRPSQSTINLRWDPHQGFVEVPASNTSTGIPARFLGPNNGWMVE